MLDQDSKVGLAHSSDLNQLKVELNQIPAIDAGDYIADLLPSDRAIAFRLMNKGQAIEA